LRRRKFTGQGLAALFLGLSAALGARAQGQSQGLLAQLSPQDATAGLKLALERGATAAVALLGRPDGFLGDPKVRIPLPPALDPYAGMLRALGQQRRLDDLVTSMNRAAEAAVPEAKALLVNAVKTMSVADARQILTGGDTSVTDFFASRTRLPLGERFLPIVTRETQRVRLARQYNDLAGRAAKLGFVREENAQIEAYVTTKALDGLYFMIGEEERKIRKDPVGTGSDLLRRVFGSLR
jgi:hypothetical protein